MLLALALALFTQPIVVVTHLMVTDRVLNEITYRVPLTEHLVTVIQREEHVFM